MLTPGGPETGFATGLNVKLAVALSAGSAELVAVTVTVAWELRLAGAAYNPLTIVPILGVTDQLTPVLLVPCTDAVNCTDWPADIVWEPGLMETLTFETGLGDDEMGCASNTVAVAVTLGFATLVAEMVTCDSLATEDGAV